MTNISKPKKPNYGKRFEQLIAKQIEAYPETSIDRIPDQTMRFKGRRNVSDFIVYRFPRLYYIECKTVHGNTLPFANISQFDALRDKSLIKGVEAGVLCWWVDKDITKWIPIGALVIRRFRGEKSVRFDSNDGKVIEGRKKKTYFEYDLRTFFGY